jgi:hypothetical protein
MDHYEDRNSKARIPTFDGDLEKFSSWMFDVQLYATATYSLDIWEGIDNPFTRPRRLEIELIDISPDEDSIFADADEDVRIFEAESARNYAQAKASWKDKVLKLFSAVGLAAKNDVKLLAIGIRMGDIASLRTALPTTYGNRSRASRFQLIMSFILLETFSVYDFEAHVSKFQELRYS